MRKTRALVGVAVVVMALSAGCGGDDSPESGDTPGASESPAEGPENGWVTVTDDASGVSADLPEDVEPQEQPAQAADGSTLTARVYAAELSNGVVGFNIFETPPDQYSLQVGAGGVAQSLGGTLASSSEIQVDGRDGLQGEVTFGENLMLFQLILLDDGVWQPYSAGPADERERIEADFDQLVESAELG